MATPPVCDFGWQAPDFSLPDTDGSAGSLETWGDGAATLVMFICNHCPYVLRALNEIRRTADDLAPLGVGVIAICSNDAAAYPDDSPENMKLFHRKHDLPFPYLHDADQAVARAWGAVCTPDFFGLDARHRLQYRGRLMAPDGRRELFEAMKQIAETGQGPRDQVASMGCSIKWKDSNWA
ncbi:thioredoxin family protein [Oceaniglobus trochenteri]|uniref:thioredoxin family protein n=1 Tax=Oceaniglobus trochenteri TaxID=2763260 RepID=UPI001CFF8DE7|nr:thioredoxin family protein [Oceaniglobus trochenteri]